MVTNSRAESTIRPTTRSAWATTIRRVFRSYAARGNPNRARRLIAGTTRPRENTTPSTNGGAFGTGVTCSIISMRWTAPLWTAYAVPASSNRTYGSAVATAHSVGLQMAAGSGVPGQPGRVQNQDRPAVPEFGRAGESGRLHERVGQLADDDLAQP